MLRLSPSHGTQGLPNDDDAIMTRLLILIKINISYNKMNYKRPQMCDAKSPLKTYLDRKISEALTKPIKSVGSRNIIFII